MKKNFKYLLYLAIALRVIFAFIVWHPDVNNHIDWGIRFWEYGPKAFYSQNVWSFTWPNQPPGTIYIFALVRKLFEAIFSFFWFINVKIPLFPSGIVSYFEYNLYPALLQLPGILADFGIAWIIFKLFQKEKKEKVGMVASIAFLLNPAIWYNSAFWGQYDSVINFFAILSFYYLLKEKTSLAIISFLASIYIKASLLVYAPIFLVVALRKNKKISGYVWGVVASLVIFGVLTLPFSKGNTFIWLFNIYKDKVFFQQLHVITANAFNIWSAIAGIHERPETLLLGPLSYKMWGIILFALSYIPAIYLVFKKQSVKSVFWALSIVSFSTFMLLTNMHERYLYPFFPVFTVIAFMDKKMLGVYWATSFLNVVNLYNFWWTPRLETLINVMSFKDRLLPRVLSLVNFGLFAYIYSYFLRQKKLFKL